MGKTIFKEIVITLLICIVIILLLAVLFYQYIPANKIIPSKVTAYQTPANVASEIGEQNTTTEISATNQTYEITDSDLSVYKQSKSYNPGKVDPFADYSAQNSNTTENTTGIENTVTTDKNVTDNYYQSSNIIKGTK